MSYSSYISSISGNLGILINYKKMAHSFTSYRPSAIALAFALSLCYGCSKGDQPPLGTVSGTVTLDGQPKAGLRVLFSQPGFRSSGGFTDQNGYYELKYLRGTMGAAVGTHSVRIDPVTKEGEKTQKQLPVKYNRKTELTAKVEPGSNVIDFELQSE